MGKPVDTVNIRAFGRSTLASREPRETTQDNALLSAALIVGVPLLFWMLVLEGAALLFGFAYGPYARLVVGGILGALLLIIWSCMRQTK